MSCVTLWINMVWFEDEKSVKLYCFGKKTCCGGLTLADNCDSQYIYK